MVQQNVCTEPKDNPQEAFRFAVAFEEGINQHHTFESGKKRSQKRTCIRNRTKTFVLDVG